MLYNLCDKICLPKKNSNSRALQLHYNISRKRMCLWHTKKILHARAMTNSFIPIWVARASVESRRKSCGECLFHFFFWNINSLVMTNIHAQHSAQPRIALCICGGFVQIVPYMIFFISNGTPSSSRCARAVKSAADSFDIFWRNIWLLVQLCVYKRESIREMYFSI